MARACTDMPHAQSLVAGFVCAHKQVCVRHTNVAPSAKTDSPSQSNSYHSCTSNPAYGTCKAIENAEESFRRLQIPMPTCNSRKEKEPSSYAVSSYRDQTWSKFMLTNRIQSLQTAIEQDTSKHNKHKIQVYAITPNAIPSYHNQTDSTLRNWIKQTRHEEAQETLLTCVIRPRANTNMRTRLRCTRAWPLD